MDERAYWLGFHLIPNIGAVRIARLVEAFGSLECAWSASIADFEEAGMNRRAARAVDEYRARIDLEREWERVRSAGAEILTLADDDYPRLLRQIQNPPAVLYVKGRLEPDDETGIGVVGTRRVTRYGREMTERLTTGLAIAGVTIVSGLARGIDGIAHTAALDNGGRTLAVLGSGLDQIYPPEHRKLGERIADQGALITEFPLGTRPEARNFPIRNRLISGLSLGILVIEAPRRSGALITASFAADQGRSVFAVPGSALSTASEGCHELLRNGAALAAEVDDILDDLNLERRQAALETRKTLPEASRDERQILDMLSREPKHIDEIAIDTGINISELSALLLQMQLKGLVRDAGGQHYARD